MYFKNKIVLVTGSDSGIGLSITKFLFKQACNVIATKFILGFDRRRNIR